MNLYVIFPEYLFYQPKRKYNGQPDHWWLRSPYYDGYAYLVYPDGYVSYNNHNVRNSYGQADYWWLRSPNLSGVGKAGIAFYVGSDGNIYGYWRVDYVSDSYGLSSYISIYSITPS